MLRNYLKIAFRNLRKHKAYSLINIAGLAIGLACFTLIMLYVAITGNKGIAPVGSAPVTAS